VCPVAGVAPTPSQECGRARHVLRTWMEQSSSPYRRGALTGEGAAHGAPTGEGASGGRGTGSGAGRCAMSPAIGFRVWRIDEMLTEPRLASPHRFAAWLPGVPLKAECKGESGPRALANPHQKQPGVAPPVESCTCGIYAYHD